MNLSVSQIEEAMDRLNAIREKLHNIYLSMNGSLGDVRTEIDKIYRDVVILEEEVPNAAKRRR